MENKLISIIVPVYNVEKYVSRCVESLISQTYSNIQIIVVNDGTKDHSREIVKQYQKNDSRIELYDKENGGLSDARNYALNYVRGEYICFVDSDDYVSSDYVKKLFSLFDTDIDIACGGFEYFYDDQRTETKERMKQTILNHNEALYELCNGKWMTNHVWNKMYRTDLFQNIRFERGRCFEDIYIMHLLFSKANKIACTDEILYHYYMREESIIHQIKPQNNMDIFIAYYKRYEFVEGSELKKIVLKYCAWACYKVIYLSNCAEMNENDLTIAKQFWKDHIEISELGIKYWTMYKLPLLYKSLFC